MKNLEPIARAILQLRQAFRDCGLDEPTSIEVTHRTGEVFRSNNLATISMHDPRAARDPDYIRTFVGMPIHGRRY